MDTGALGVFIILLGHFRLQWFLRQSDPFYSHNARLQPNVTGCVTSRDLNLEQLELPVKPDKTITCVPYSSLTWANCSPDVNIRSHPITLHSEARVGVQVNLN